MQTLRAVIAAIAASSIASLHWLAAAAAQEPAPKKSSFSPVVPKEDFAAVERRMAAAKSELMARQKGLLGSRSSATSPVSTWTSTCPITSSPSSRRRSS